MAERNLVIVDYGMGNLRSVQKALEKVGYSALITADPQVVKGATHLVLPGVGAFKDAIGRIKDIGLDKVILDHLYADRPFFGICLGLQLLFEWSWEDGKHAGLGFYNGDVVHFPLSPGLKIPHMGWNQLRVSKEIPILTGYYPGSSVYFVHSYHGQPENPNVVAAWCDYGIPFAAAIGDCRRMATQFHPEKSQKVGLAMLQKFAEIPG